VWTGCCEGVSIQSILGEAAASFIVPVFQYLNKAKGNNTKTGT
jgi:hypothetical protein